MSRRSVAGVGRLEDLLDLRLRVEAAHVLLLDSLGLLLNAHVALELVRSVQI